MAGFVLNRRGLTDTLNAGPARQAIDEASAAVVEDAAQAVHSESGRTAKSYKVGPAQAGPDGAVGTAYTDSPIGHIIEWGSEDTAPQAPLRKGARAAGLKLKEASK